jgi:hypothetical protein
MPSSPKIAASGIHTSSTARPMSAQIISGRRRRRSTQTPATSPSTTPGRMSAMRISATSPGDASRVMMATSGSANREIRLPASETV